VKFLSETALDKEDPIKFWKSVESRILIRTPDPDLVGFIAEICALYVIHIWPSFNALTLLVGSFDP